MTTYYHGTTALFDHFDISHLFEGNGKCKFGVGIYATSVFRTAVVYAKKGRGDTPYVYTLEVPDLTNDNHIVSAKPVHKTIISKTEERLGPLPDEVKQNGKSFRKYVGNLLIENKGTTKKLMSKLSLDGELAVSRFLSSIGVKFLVWPNAQSNPQNGEINVAILDNNIIKITEIKPI